MTPKKPHAIPSAPTGHRPNSIGIQSRELEQLCNLLDVRTSAEAARKRDFIRWPFRHASLALKIVHPGSTTVQISVACRNLSCGGISVMHSAYVHLGSPVIVTLPHPKLGSVDVDGTVSRCSHLRGVVHEIGIKFTKSINARDFVNLDAFTDAFSLEKVNHEELRGCVLHLEDSELDRKLVQHYLRGTQLRVRPCLTIDEALKLAQEGCDLVVASVDMQGMESTDIVAKFREDGVQAPIIVVTNDTTPATRQRIADMRANAFITKPLKQDVLVRAIGEFLMVGSQTGSLATTLKADDPNAPLVDGFVDFLHNAAGRLEDILKRDDAAQCRQICLQIKGTAPALGFDAVGKLADDAAHAVAASMSVAESIKPVRQLISACMRVRSDIAA
ncbi:MAG: response regulator [Planctomycetota bacterium]|nr:response regulator [Planctomycetota bacterium]